MTQPDARGERLNSLGRPATPTWLLVILLMLVVGLGHFNRVGMKVAGDARIIAKPVAKEGDESAGAANFEAAAESGSSPGEASRAGTSDGDSAETDKGISPTQFGMVISAFLLTYTLAMIPGGWFIDRFGPRRALALQIIGSAVFVFLTAVVGFVCKSPTAVLIGLFVVRSLMGIINAPLHPGAATMVYRYAPPRRRSLINGSVTFAAVVGVAVTFNGFGWLIDHSDWPISFLMMSLLTFGIGVIWLLATRGVAQDHRPLQSEPERVVEIESLDQPRSTSWLHLFRNRSVVFVTLSYAALGYYQYLFFYWIEYYFSEVVGLDNDAARWYSTLITLAMGVAMAFGGGLTDILPTSISADTRRRIVPGLGLAGSGIMFLCVQFSSNSSLMFPAFVAAAALLGASEAAFWTTANELGGQLGGTAGGVMNAGGNAGGVLSPTMTPWLGALFGAYYGEAVGWRISLAIAGIISIVGAFFWLGVRLPKDDAENRASSETA